MPQKLRITGKPVPRLRVTGTPVPRVDPKQVGEALGGEPIPGAIDGHPGPVMLYALRAEIMRRRRSSGGRPGIEGTDARVKIPVRRGDWQAVEKMAAAVTTTGFSPSPAQVASVLFAVAVDAVTDSSSEGDRGPLAEAVKQKLRELVPLLHDQAMKLGSSS